MANNDAKGAPVPSPSDPKMSGNDETYIDNQTPADKRDQLHGDSQEG